jgi:hypothetical protein
MIHAQLKFVNLKFYLIVIIEVFSMIPRFQDELANESYMD